MKYFKLLLYFAFIGCIIYSIAMLSCAASVDPEIKSFTVSEQTHNSISLKWKSNDAKISGYKVYKYIKSTKTTVLLSSLKADVNEYTQNKLLSGTDYCFKIRSYYKSNGSVIYSKMKTLDTYTLIPKVTGLTVTSNSDVFQEISWKAISGIKTYNIYYLNKNTNKYVLLGTKTANSAKLKCTPATSYTYKVKATANVQSGKTKISGKASNPVSAVSKSKLVENFAYSSVTEDTITLTWSPANKASGYRIYQYDASNKKYAAVANTKKTTFKISSLSPAKQYKFKIKSYSKVDGANIYSDASEVLSVVTKPKKVAVSQQKDSLNNSCVTLSWTKSTRASGYLIYVSNHKNSGFSLYKQVSGDELTTTVTGLENGVPQYVKIKAYSTVGSTKAYSEYSKLLTVYA